MERERGRDRGKGEGERKKSDGGCGDKDVSELSGDGTSPDEKFIAAAALFAAMEPVTLPVVVVGGGLAGLSATLAASLAGATLVILLEKETVLGGNSAKAISGITAAVTPWQHDVSDSLDSFAMDHFLSCRGEDPLLPPSTLVAAGLQQDESSSLFSELLWYKPRNDFLLSRAAYDPSLGMIYSHLRC